MYAVIDIETGGFAHKKNAICEVAVIIADKDKNEIDRYHCFIKPYNVKREDGELFSYKEDAMNVNGLTIEFLEENGIDIEIAFNEIKNLIIKHRARNSVCHNKDFDMKFMNFYFDMFCENFRFEKELCTMKESKNVVKLSSYSLGSLCEHFEIVNENAHSGISDAIATLELFKRL
jgi:DNA polymerase-3 subunit epsilon